MPHENQSQGIHYTPLLSPHRWTLELVLQGDWPSLQRIVKTRLSTSLHRCCKDPILDAVIGPLLPLVSNPWEGEALKLVLDSDSDTSEEGRLT